MADKAGQDQEFYPFGAALGKQLTHKVYEQRKTAALDVERLVRQYATAHNTELLTRAVDALAGKTFALSQNQNNRKGGLIGLAAFAIAVGTTDIRTYLDTIIRPILSSFNDADGNVRYFACESLYNVVKVARRAALPYFPQLFDMLSRLCCDPQQNVRSGFEVLDRLMKDIVTESHEEFELNTIIDLLCEKVYSKNPNVRQFVISWLRVLDSVPELDVLCFLPKLLEGLFQILNDPQLEVRAPCESLLGEFLHSIVEKPDSIADYSSMLNILVVHAQQDDELIQFTALLWIKQFLKVSSSKSSNSMLLPFTAGILVSILPCLAYDGDGKKQLRDIARQVNQELMMLVPKEGNDVAETTLSSKSSASDIIKLDAVVVVLVQQLERGALSTRLATLRWLYQLLHQMPLAFFQLCVGKVLPTMLEIIKVGSEEAVLSDLELLTEICTISANLNIMPSDDILLSQNDKTIDADEQQQQQNNVVKHSSVAMLASDDAASSSSYFRYILTCILVSFRDDRSLLTARGAFIIRRLCSLLKPDDIYTAFSDILLNSRTLHAAPEFIATMVHSLNTILMTASEFYALRAKLKNCMLLPADSLSSSSKDADKKLFSNLFYCWCYSPMTAISLCLLSQQYELAGNLVICLAQGGEITIDTLVELDRLVQLIESPIFSFLRLAILDGNAHLVNALHALLMILPQTEAFQTLKNRIQFAGTSAALALASPVNSSMTTTTTTKATKSTEVVRRDFYGDLIRHFKKVNKIDNWL